MKPKNSGRNRLTVALLSIVLLFVPFCLAYLFHVSSQRSFYTNRNFRVLESVGTQIALKVDNLAENLRNTASKAKRELDEQRSQAAATYATSFKSALQQINRYGTTLRMVSQPISTQAQKSPASTQSANPQQQSPEQRQPQPTQTKAPTPRSASQLPNRRARTLAAGNAAKDQPTDPRVTLGVKPDQGAFWLVLTHDGWPKAGIPEQSVATNVDTLFEPLVTRFLLEQVEQTNEHLFDEILIAEQSDGRVIFERGQAGLRLVNINGLVGKDESKLSDRSSTILDVELAGTLYKLYLHPVQLPLSSTQAVQEGQNGAARWVVCGLVSTNNFRDQTFAVSYTVIVSFFFLLVLSLFSLPLIKLGLMGPRDRLTRTNLAGIVFSALVGTSFLTFVLVGSYTYFTLERKLDYQLQHLAQDIKANLNKELTSALKQLKDLNDQLLSSEKTHDAVQALKASIGRTDIEEQNGKPGPITTRGEVRILESLVPYDSAPYPFFNSVVWVDTTGEQRIKWTTRNDTTAFIRVADRPYFINARERERLWSIRDNSSVNPNGEYRYALDLVNSRNTGENVAILAMMVPGSRWVSSMDTRLLSLMGAVLPEGYGYAVIDSSGKVLFHSSEVKNLEEQFFEENQNDGILRAAVLGRTSEFVNAKYLGRGHRLYVTPLTDQPWSLVVFRDKQMLRTMNLEILTLSLFLYLGFLILMLVVIGVVCLLRKRGRSLWLWPCSKEANRYIALTVLNLGLGLLLLPVIIFADGWLLLGLSVAIPIAGLMLFTCAPNQWLSNVGAKITFLKEISYRRIYLCSFTTLVALIAVLPTLAYFRLVRDFEIGVMLRHGQMSIARALEAREDRVNRQYAAIKIGLNDSQKERFLTQRRLRRFEERDWDVYSEFFFNTKLVYEPPQIELRSGIGSLEDLLTKLSPLFDQLSVQKREFSHSGSDDRSWLSGGNPYNGMFLSKTSEVRARDGAVYLRSQVDPFEAINQPSWWAIMGLYAVAVLGIIFLLNRFVARRIFLLDIDQSVAAAHTDLGAQPVVCNRLVIRPAVPNGGDQWAPAHYQVIDLKRLATEPDWQWKPETLREDVAVVLENFQTRMDDPVANREKLRILEQLLAEKRRVVVVTSVAPLNFQLQSPQPTKQEGDGDGKKPTRAAKAAEQKSNGAEAVQSPENDGGDYPFRWARAFDSFDHVYQSGHITVDKTEEANKACFYSALKATGHVWGYLERIRKDLSQSCSTLTREELIHEVTERARASHQEIWIHLTKEEKLALIHLAVEGLVACTNPELRRLMKRGLIVRDPRLRLMDESFRRFVLGEAEKENVRAWEKEGRSSTWEIAKFPLVLLLGMLGLFLFVTQKDIFDSTLTMVTGLTAGVAAILKLLGMFSRDKIAPPTG